MSVSQCISISADVHSPRQFMKNITSISWNTSYTIQSPSPSQKCQKVYTGLSFLQLFHKKERQCSAQHSVNANGAMKRFDST